MSFRAVSLGFKERHSRLVPYKCTIRFSVSCAHKLKFIGVSKRTIKKPGVVPLLYIRQYVNCTTEPKLAWSLSVEICLQSAWSLRSGCGADLGQAQGMPRKTKKALDSCQVLFSWWRRRGSNSRPYGCEPYALPAELRPHSVILNRVCAVRKHRFKNPTQPFYHIKL